MALGLRANRDGITTRQITAPATGPTSDAASPVGTLPLANITDADDIKAIEALDATAGLLAKTGANAYARRTLTGDSEIVVANGSGAAGNPALSIGAAIARAANVVPTGGTLLDTTALDALTFSSPPTQAEVQALQSAVSSLLATVRVHA